MKKIFLIILLLITQQSYAQIYADSTVTVRFANNSGETIYITNAEWLYDLGTDSTFRSYSLTPPDTIANDDTLDVEFVINRDQPDGTRNNTLRLTETYATQDLPISVRIVGDTTTTPPEPPASSSIWWVSSAGNGYKTGTDSANAWSITNIVQDSIEAGDTILFIEGTYTTGLDIQFDGDASNLVTLMPNPTNTGDVTFYGVNQAIHIANGSYIRIKGLKFNRCKQSVYIEETSNVIFLDSLDIRKNTEQAAISIVAYDGTPNPAIDSVWVRWCYVNTDSQYNAQTDVIFCMLATNVFILNNVLIQSNLDNTDPGTNHDDCIQFYQCGNIMVANNWLEQYKLSASQVIIAQNWDTTMAYTPGAPPEVSSPAIANGWSRYYNNILYTTGQGTAGAIDGGGSSYKTRTLEIYNNTIVATNNTSWSWAMTESIDSTKQVNNIFVASSDRRQTINLNSPNGNYTKYHHNLYHGQYEQFVTGLPGINYWVTMSGWTGTYGAEGGGTPNGFWADPLFTNKAGLDFTLQVGSPAINTGADLQSIVEGWGVDGVEWTTFDNPYISGADGDARDSSPDIGAY